MVIKSIEFKFIFDLRSNDYRESEIIHISILHHQLIGAFSVTIP